MNKHGSIRVYTVELYMSTLGTEVDVHSDLSAWICAGKDSYATDTEVPPSMRQKASLIKLGKVRPIEGLQKELDLECKDVHTEVDRK